MCEVREGRLEPMEVLFERHHGRVFHFFLGLTRHRSHSEDLVQELFLRMLKYRRSFKPGSPFCPWMFTIARRLNWDLPAHPRAETTLETWHETLPDGREDAQRSLERSSDEQLLALALERLGPHKRELLLLSRDPDLSYKDLAGIFGCSEGSVKVQVHRALKELRTVFQDLQGGAS